MLPTNYTIRRMDPADFGAIISICRVVYPEERPYTVEELEDHRRVFSQGQFVAVENTRNEVAGVHFTLKLRMSDFHADDSWDVLTANGTFLDHDPAGHTLYGADIMVHPRHQHHGIAHGLTDRTRELVVAERLWRMVGASRLPGYGKVSGSESIDEYVASVIRGTQTDPVLSAHLKDGWSPVRPIRGYLQHDPESAGWAEVIQWVNPACPRPPEREPDRPAR